MYLSLLEISTERPFLWLQRTNVSAPRAQDGRCFSRALSTACVTFLFCPGLGEWAVREMVFAGFDGISCHGQAIKSHACKWSKRTLQPKVPDNACSHYRIQVFRTILISLGKVDCCSVLLTGKLHHRTKICVNNSAGCKKMNIIPFSEGFSKVILPQLLSNI